MKNKAVVVTITEVSFAGEILNGAMKENGILFKPSDKSGIKMWFPLDEIKKIVLPDATEVSGEELESIFEKLDNITREYGLEEVL